MTVSSLTPQEIEAALRAHVRAKLQPYKWPSVEEVGREKSRIAGKRLAKIYRDIEKDYADVGRRALCLEDRFYLLTHTTGRVDVFHPCLYARGREVEANPDGSGRTADRRQRR